MPFTHVRTYVRTLSGRSYVYWREIARMSSPYPLHHRKADPATKCVNWNEWRENTEQYDAILYSGRFGFGCINVSKTQKRGSTFPTQDPRHGTVRDDTDVYLIPTFPDWRVWQVTDQKPRFIHSHYPTTVVVDGRHPRAGLDRCQTPAETIWSIRMNRAYWRLHSSILTSILN